MFRPTVAVMTLLAGACGADDKPAPDALPARVVQVVVETPNGGELLVAAEPVTVQWSATDSASAALMYELALVDDRGAATPIALAVAAAPFTWTPVGVAAPTPYRIRVTATTGDGATGADESDAPFTVSPPTTGVSLARDVQPIFTASCLTMFCHGTASQVAQLHLAPGFAHASLVEVSSATVACGAYKRVRAGLPDQSYLLWKLAGTGPCFTGVRMPKDATPLSAADTMVIRDWITQGAKNN